MLKLNNLSLNERQINILEFTLIIIFSLLPVFFNFPYRINIYLSWEGAYRLYLGQVPYRDFGLPMGFGFWVIPALFFKIFGPYLITLIKAQAFINIISAFAFHFILKQLKVKPAIRLLSVFLYLLSFSFVNFWPWYNHSVIVFEFIGMAFLLNYILNKRRKYALTSLFLGCFFLFLSFFTKQDAGALGFMVAFVLIVCQAIFKKKIWPVVWFLGFYIFIGLCFFLPFIPYHIGYWFNYGQAPHSARLSLYDIFDIFFGSSEWIKFYILVIVLIWVVKLKNFKDRIKDKRFVIFSLLVAGILFEAAVFQVTSYIPEYNNIFFHSFAIAYIFSFSGLPERINFKRLPSLCLATFLIMLWWSSRSWQYANRVIARYLPGEKIDTNEVSIHTFMRSDPYSRWGRSKVANRSNWGYAPWEPFKKVSMPKPTIKGMERLVNSKVVKSKGKQLKVLNMSELTPLAKVIGYTPETGHDIPLWYHKNVAMFEKQIKEYNKKIDKNYYDVVLFEYIPILNNFYPFEIRDSLKVHYKQVDSFPGPRSMDYSVIEVYVKKP